MDEAEEGKRRTILELQKKWKDEFSRIPDEFDRYTYLMVLGEKLTGIPEKKRTKDMLFSGCQSNVWVYLGHNKGKLLLQLDSDTLIVRGILFILEDLLNGCSLEEVAGVEVTLLQELELESVFNTLRRKGMTDLLLRVRQYAADCVSFRRRKGMSIKPLLKEDICKVIEGRGKAERVPLLYDIWIYDNVFDFDGEKRREWISSYPCDVDEVFLRMPGTEEGYAEDPDFYWAAPGFVPIEEGGLDARPLIEEWEDADAFFETFPDPDSPALIPEKKDKDGRYLLGRWWYCFFERLWYLRGMENALTDFYLYPDEIHRLFQKLTDFYIRIMERAKEELDVDGFFVSDDIGTQKAPFFSLEIFREFFKPYYKQLFDKAHQLGTHFWLHSCGNIELFLPDLIEIGLDVIHPIQKNTMDEKVIAEKYGDQICILAGIDVQYLMAFGSPEEVRAEIEYLLHTYDRPEGRLMMTMGNGSTPDWKLENLEMMYRASMDLREGEN